MRFFSIAPPSFGGSAAQPNGRVPITESHEINEMNQRLAFFSSLFFD